MTVVNPEWGAYGLALRGLEAARRWLVEAPRTWPVFAVDVEIGNAQEREERVLGGRAELLLRTGGELHVDADARTILFRLPGVVDAGALAHPFLAPAAEVTAHLMGRESFHAGAVAAQGGAWAVVGERGAGKSSTLAALAAAGYGVVADDVLVLDGGSVLAGPRAIDLRRETAQHLGVGDPIGIAGGRERWRLHLAGVEPELPLRGWIFLAWGGAGIRRLRGPETLERLAASRGVNLPPPIPAALLTLAALPAYEVSRAGGMESLDATAQAVLEIASGAR
jgi:hypothetical protein